jgi:hypothetical protein
VAGFWKTFTSPGSYLWHFGKPLSGDAVNVVEGMAMYFKALPGARRWSCPASLLRCNMVVIGLP